MGTNTTLLVDTMKAFNAGDIDRCLAAIHPDFIINLAGAPEQLIGRDTWHANLRGLLAGFPDLRMEVQDAFEQGDKVAVRNILRGTHTGEFYGIPATGRTIEIMSNEIYRVTNGIIVEEWIVTDTASLFAQITDGPDRPA